MELYNRIKKRREELGLSQEELAKKMGYKSRSSINKIERGTNDIPQSKISAFAKALDVSEAWLMGYDVPISPVSDDIYRDSISVDTIVFEITGRSLQYSPLILDAICRQFEKTIANNNNTDSFTNGKHTINNICDLLRSPDVSFDDKALALNAIVDIIFYNTKKRELDIYCSLNNNSRQNRINKIVSISQKLNSLGMRKVFDYASDLANMPIYTNADQKTSGEESGYYANAAHDDEESTPEERKAGDDIMTDDSEWE